MFSQIYAVLDELFDDMDVPSTGSRVPSQAPMPAGPSDRTGERADLRRRHPAAGSRAPSQAPMPQPSDRTSERA
eukprot:801660-Heterocapsa_arctica.AAC.1